MFVCLLLVGFEGEVEGSSDSDVANAEANEDEAMRFDGKPVDAVNGMVLVLVGVGATDVDVGHVKNLDVGTHMAENEAVDVEDEGEGVGVEVGVVRGADGEVRSSCCLPPVFFGSELRLVK